ncbi:MAG: Xenobiotic-transporting ATPase, partial [candidate division WS6 bacterium 34_10]
VFKLLKYLKPYILLILLLLGLTYAQVMASLALPDYMAKIVNEGIVNQDVGLIWSTGVTMILITLGGAVASVISGYLAAKIGTGFSKNLREAVFKKVESFSMEEFNNFSTASLITRSTNDIQQMQMVVIILFRMVLSAPIMGIGAVIKASSMAPSMTWIMGIAVAVLLTIIIILFVVAVPKFKIVQQLIDKLNLVTRQNLTGLRVIKAFNTEDYEKVKFDEVNKDLTKINLFINRVMVIMQPIMMLVFNITTIAIIWIGSHRIDVGELQIGEMMAFMQYAMQVIISFLMISIIFILIPRASVSAQRISEVLEASLHILDPKKPKKSKGKGEVLFKDVTFTYPDADVPVLYNISFTAKPGETTAIIGGTGSGKSTVVNLIPRFFDVTSGEILIDGVDVRDIKKKDLRRRIGYIPQKGVLFSGTIESNIKYGKPNATMQEVQEAARVAQASEFISQLENGYDSHVAQGGSNFSGGQKQRLAIARAIIANPDIYIFDDSFSALDFETDYKLRGKLKTITKDSTVIIVAQRIGTILHADKIVVLDNGRVVGIGKHKELLKDCEVYKEIASSQLSEKELENE